MKIEIASSLVALILIQVISNTSFAAVACEFAFIRAANSSRVETQLLSAKWINRLEVRYSVTSPIAISHSEVAYVEGRASTQGRKQARERFESLTQQSLEIGARSADDKYSQEERGKFLDQALQLDDRLLFPISDFLKNSATSHLLVHSENGPTAIVVLPNAGSSWGKLAQQLYEQTGTLLIVDRVGLSHFIPLKNALMVSYETVLRGKPSDRELQIAKKLLEERVSEKEIPVSGAETVDVPGMLSLMDPENAVPGSLQFYSFFSGYDVQQKIPPYRYSVRTGKVSDLAPEIRSNLEAMVAYNRSSSQPVATVGLRDNRKKTWSPSFPEAGPTQNVLSVLANGVGFLKADQLPRRQGVTDFNLPDLFLMVTGFKQISGGFVDLLKALAQDGNQGLNSVSFVVIVPTRANGSLYYIHTVDIAAGFDLTPRADLLKHHFDHRQAARAKTPPPFNFDLD